MYVDWTCNMSAAMLGSRLLSVWTTVIFVVIICVQETLSQKRTDFVQALLIGDYDSRIPPNFDKDVPCDVNVSLYINSIDSIDEQSMDFTLGMIVQQHWQDKRLRFLNLIPAKFLELDARLMEGIWVPDLYVRNEKKAYFHTVTFPNKMLRLHSDGTINYRSRMTITASCPMKLHKYPMDQQICSLYIQSFAYSMNRLVFHWREESPVRLNPDLELPQFTPYKVESHHCQSPNIGDGNFSCIRLDLYLKRNIGYYMIQMYVPSVLVVSLSWLSFWLHVQAVPARISLGILTVLTMTTQRSMANSSLPRVSYVKAIDVWMAVCLCFVFGALLEYACVNVLSRNRELRMDCERQTEKEININNVDKCGGPSTSIKYSPVLPNPPDRAQSVDNASKLLFPLVFVVFCGFYWVLYLYTDD